jgi:hypothetical protein
MIKRKVGYGNEGGMRNVSRRIEGAVSVNIDSDRNAQAGGMRSEAEATMEISG